MMLSNNCKYYSILFLIYIQCYYLILLVSGTSNNNVAPIDSTTEGNNKKYTEEELLNQLQTHIAAQVNQLVKEHNVKPNKNGDLELSVDKLHFNLPPDLAELVKKSGVFSGMNNVIKFSKNENGQVDKLQSITSNRGTMNIDDSVKTIKSTKTPCPLGTYSETGHYYVYSSNSVTEVECMKCPEGQTTIRVGSTKCQVVTEEDLLVILYDLMNGELLCSGALLVVVNNVCVIHFFAHIMCSYIHIYLTQGINGMKKYVEIGRRIRMYVTGQVYRVMILVRLSVYHSQRRFCLVLSGSNKAFSAS